MTLAGFFLVVVGWSSGIREAIKPSFGLVDRKNLERELMTKYFAFSTLHFSKWISFILLVRRCPLLWVQEISPSFFMLLLNAGCAWLSWPMLRMTLGLAARSRLLLEPARKLGVLICFLACGWLAGLGRSVYGTGGILRVYGGAIPACVASATKFTDSRAFDPFYGAILNRQSRNINWMLGGK